MFYYLINRLPVVLGILIVALPFLSRNRIYRTATLFAALNAGVICILFFADIQNSDSDFIDTEAIAFFSVLTLPSLYFASLFLGATIIAQGTQKTTRPLRVVLAVIGGPLLCAYLTPLLFKIIATPLSGMRPSRFWGILKPEIGREFVALIISTAVSVLITIMITRRSERGNG
jgi:hypothetical protein